MVPNRASGSLTKIAFVKDCLGSVRDVVDLSDGTVLEQNDYYAFGERVDDSSMQTTSINRWRFNAKEEQDSVARLPYLDYGARLYDPVIGRWLHQDPEAAKYPHLSPYNFCGDNPVNFVDPQGDTIIVSNLGLIMSNDYKDNTVMLYQEDGNKYIGTIGVHIDISDIAPNILLHNSELAKEMNIIDFYHAVKETGLWDLKYNSNTIFGYIWCKEKDNKEDIKTEFSFGDYDHLTAADFGNYHFGYVGSFVYSGKGIPPYILLKGAGSAEAMKEWREGNKFISLMRFEQFLDPRSLVSGDRPRDYYWTTQGIKEARRQKKN